jgi:hypothetical protein
MTTTDQPHDFIRQQAALKKINAYLAKSPLDYTQREVVLYAGLSAASLFFAYSASAFFLKLGAEGTQYLPIGHFSNSTGGIGAATSNTILNWYFIVSTVLNIRMSYYHHQILKQLEIPPKRWKAGLKILTASIFSLAAASVMAMIASSRENHFQRNCTFFVNALLNFHGAMALLNSVIQLSYWLRHPNLNNVSPSLKMIPHVIMQSFNVIFNYGYIKDTTKNLKGNTGLAVLVLIPFFALCAFILYETTNSMIHLCRPLFQNLAASRQPTDAQEEPVKKKLHAYFGGLFMIGGYFLSYLSSNTTLALNAQYGWNDWWNIWPSVIGTMAFNGYGFICLFKSSNYLLMHPDEKSNRQTTDFFMAHPKALDQLAEEEIIGLQPFLHE